MNDQQAENVRREASRLVDVLDERTDAESVELAFQLVKGLVRDDVRTLARLVDSVS